MPYKDPEKQKENMKRYRERLKEEGKEPHRAWMLIFYPESAPEEWPELLSEMQMKIWVGTHDKDVWSKADEKRNPKHKAGSPKKTHCHLIADYESGVNRNKFLEDFSFLNGPSNVKAVNDKSSSVRYLIHADDPDKAQYDRTSIKIFGGANLDALDVIGLHDRHEALKAMRKYIRENRIESYADFSDYCDECENQWARLLDDNSSYRIDKYIKSNAFRMSEIARKTDPATGEFLEQGKEEWTEPNDSR